MEIYVLHRPSTDVVTLDRLENATPEVACMRTCILYMHRIYMWLPTPKLMYLYLGGLEPGIYHRQGRQARVKR